jgi:hypothetical protein
MGYAKILKKKCKFCGEDYTSIIRKGQFCSQSCWGKYAYRHNTDRRDYLRKRSKRVYHENKNNLKYKKIISEAQKRYADRNKEYFKKYMREYMRRKNKIKPENYRVAIGEKK